MKKMFVIGLIFMGLFLSGCQKYVMMEKEEDIDWTIRSEFNRENKHLFAIFPDPALSPGRDYGYMFSFDEPFEVYKGKELSIHAYHKESGEKITVLPPQKITEPSPGYKSLNRFTTRMNIPYPGTWRYEVLLDNEFYGDVVLKLKEWQPSPIFQVGNYPMIGIENRVGFIYDDEVTRFYPNKKNKYMWHFWGENEEFQGKLTVKAVHESSEKEVIILESVPLGGANNGADRHTPSLMSFPEAGMWMVKVYIGENLFDSFFIRVYED